MLNPMNLRKRKGVYHIWFERSKEHPNGKLLSLKTKDEDEAKEKVLVNLKYYKIKIIN